ncbi:hypothetical protein Tco_0824869 [Tanacetum coccineum]
MEDAELINENRIPINAYSEAFLCHMGISRNYFRSPEEVPTFIGDDGQGGCLSFRLPRLVVGTLIEEFDMVTKPNCAAKPLWCAAKSKFASERGQIVTESNDRTRLQITRQVSLEPCSIWRVRTIIFAWVDIFAIEWRAVGEAGWRTKVALTKVCRLHAAMSNWNAGGQAVLWGSSDVCLARVKAEAVEELHEKKLLTLPAAHGMPPRALMPTGLLIPNSPVTFAQLQFSLSFPVSVTSWNLFALEKEIPVEGRTSPELMEYQLRRATMSPKDIKLLGKLEDAGNVAYQVCSSERSRCHNI